MWKYCIKYCYLALVGLYIYLVARDIFEGDYWAAAVRSSLIVFYGFYAWSYNKREKKWQEQGYR